MKNKLVKKCLLLLCIALIGAFALDALVFQPRAFVSPRYPEQSIPLSQITDASGVPLSPDGAALRLPFDASGSATLMLDGLNTRTDTLRLRLSGDPVQVDVAVSIRDMAVQYDFQEALRGQVVPGAEDVDTLNGRFISSDALKGLQMTFSVPRYDGETIFLEELVFNAPCVYAFEPVRLFVLFGLLALVLCLSFLPWRHLVYDPRSWKQGLALLLSMLAVMALAVVLSIHALPPVEGDPTHGLFQGRTLKQAYNDMEDAYGQLFLAIRNHGQLSLPYELPPELLELENPYDYTARAKFAEYLFDYAMYDGQYYVYFGIAPMLLTYSTLYRLTGSLPTPALSCLLLALLAIPLLYLAVIGFVRKFTWRANPVLLTLACAAVALLCAGPGLYTFPGRYTAVMLANIGMMAGALGFGYHAVLARSGWQRTLLFLCCGGCFGIQAMARANTLLITTAFLAPAFISVLCSDAAVLKKVRDAACFLVPALIGVCLVMFFNYTRFGSVMEFGQTHQLTYEDIHYNHLEPTQLPQALYHFLLAPPQLTSVFPYVTVTDTFFNTSGNYFWHSVNLGLLGYPIIWPVLCLPAALAAYRGHSRSKRLERSFTCWAPMLVSLGLMITTYFYAGIMYRYLYDFLPAFALVSVFAGLTLSDADSTQPAVRIWQNGFAAVCVLTALLAVLLMFSYFDMTAYCANPAWFVSLIRTFSLQ